MAELGMLYVVGVIFLFFLAALWFFLPFAIFGFQPKLQKALDELKLMNRVLSEIRDQLRSRP